MRWLFVFVIFQGGAADWEIYDLEKQGVGCETAKATIIEALKTGRYKGLAVERARVECFDTVEVN